MHLFRNEPDRPLPTDNDKPDAPRTVTVTPTPREEDRIPKPKGGSDKTDSGEKKYSRWSPVELPSGDDRANKSGTNCAGTTFAKGCAYIETDEMQKILDDNYTLSATSNVCCVLAYGEKDKWHHAALIVDIDSTGKPIVWGKDGTDDVISEYSADDYSPDWKVYCRNTPPASVELTNLTAEYDAAVKNHGTRSYEAKLAAYRMCQLKNALKGI